MNFFSSPLNNGCVNVNMKRIEFDGWIDFGKLGNRRVDIFLYISNALGPVAVRGSLGERGHEEARRQKRRKAIEFQCSRSELFPLRPSSQLLFCLTLFLSTSYLVSEKGDLVETIARQ